MDKQQFDHIESGFRQAADDISINFNEAAWKKMEVKLDAEFNKDRRRVGIWWWFAVMLFVITGSGVYFYFNNASLTKNKKSFSHSQTKTIAPSAGKTAGAYLSGITDKTDQQLPSTVQEKAATAISSDTEQQKNIQNLLSYKNTVVIEQPLNASGITKLTAGTNMVSTRSEKIRKNETRPGISTGIIKKTIVPSHRFLLPGKKEHAFYGKSRFQNISGTAVTDANKIQDSPQTANTPAGKQPANKMEDSGPIGTGINALPASSKHSDLSLANIPEPAAKKDSLASQDSSSSSPGKKIVAIKLNQRTAKGFYFTASVGAGATGVREVSIKETKPVYGVGVGYRFNKRISIQTGFYAGNKAYTAGPDGYYTNPGSYISKIISAQAECYIYDIPISVRYDVAKQKNFNIYLVSGLSSYILQREYYDMHFLSPSGAYHHMSYTYKHNTGLFSVLNFSAGFERKISDVFYLQAEPYLKLPLSGVGQGSVKLYSAGLQLGFKYQPFHKKK